jgi:hypothetical protein
MTEQRVKDAIVLNRMANEKLIKALRESWEKYDGKTIEIKEGEPTFDAKDFIESLSRLKIPSRTLQS